MMTPTTCALILLAFGDIPSSGTGERLSVLLNNGWRFHLGDVRDGAASNVDDGACQSVTIPHTWNARDGQDGGNDYHRGPSWYRRKLTFDDGRGERRWFLRFAGANIVTDVFVDGEHVGQHRGGFAAFCFEITKYAAKGGEHLLAVRVDNTRVSDVPPLSADFTFDGGVYRDVQLISTPQLCISPLDFGSSGVYLRTRNISHAAAEVEATVLVSSTSTKDEHAAIRVLVRGGVDGPVPEFSKEFEAAAGGTTSVSVPVSIRNPHLWRGRRDPYVYSVDVCLYAGDKLLDRVAQPLGLRTFRVDPLKGAFLNDEPIDLHGVNMHQDRFDYGWATSASQRAEDLILIRELGCTMVRLAHYQHAEDVYAACDKLGIAVWTELGLVNEVTDSAEFRANAARQLTELIRQNMNHPSILVWGIHNEVTAPWIKNTPDPTATVRELAEVAHREDPSRPSVCAAADPLEHAANLQSDLTALNRYFGWYTGKAEDFGPAVDAFHAAHADRGVGISEYGAGASAQHHEEEPQMPRHDGPWHPEEYQAALHEVHWRAMRERPYLWCKLLWTMFDFACDARREGDTPGRNDKGLVTSDRRIRKDAYYWYKSQWSDEPFAYITSRRYTPRTASPVVVKVYSNCGEVELTVNGESRGTTRVVDGIARWEDVALREGENVIRATGRKNGREFPDECSWIYQPK